MNKHFYLFLLFNFFISFSFSQIKNEKYYNKSFKFGDVNLNDFNQKSFGKDSSAVALRLFDVGHISFIINTFGQWNYVYERHTRLKINKKEGYDYANFEIPIYKDGLAKQEITKISLAAYNLEDGKIIQTKIAKDETFNDKYNKNRTIKKFTLSNVKEQSIIEIKYTIQSDFIRFLPNWYFQREIPCLWSDFSMLIPEYLKYKGNIRTFIPVVLVKDKLEIENFVGTLKSEGISGYHDKYDLASNSRSQRWVADSIPAFDNEPFITCKEDYLAKAEFELSSINMPNSSPTYYSNTWKSIIEEYRNSEHFGIYVKSSQNFIKTLLNNFVYESDSENQKIQKIYDYVKKNIKWNGIYSDFALNSSIKQTLDNKSGNSADINLALLSFLKSSNINALPILISTRDNGTHPGQPTQGKFNFVAVSIIDSLKNIYLDATNPFLPMGYLSYSALNHKGFEFDLINDNGVWKSLDQPELSKTIHNYNFYLNDNHELVGDINMTFTSYDAIRRRLNYTNSINQLNYLKDFSNNKPGLSIDSFQNLNINNLDEPYNEKYMVKIGNFVEEAGDLLFFNPLLFERTKENPFKLENRNFPIDFAVKNDENYKIVFTIPQGYIADKLPSSGSYALNNNSASFIYNVTHDEKTIMINSKIRISKIEFSPDEYFDLKELFKIIVDKQAELIVLKKL